MAIFKLSAVTLLALALVCAHTAEAARGEHGAVVSSLCACFCASRAINSIASPPLTAMMTSDPCRRPQRN